MFTNSSKAYTWLTIVNIVTGLAALLTVTIVNFIKPSLALQLRNAFMFLPNYCFAQGLSDVYTKYGLALCYYTRDANVFFLFFFPPPLPLSSYQTILVIEQYCASSHMSLQQCCDKWGPTISLTCQANYLSLYPPGVGRYILCMIGQALVYFVLVLIFEANLLVRLFQFVFAPLRANEGETGLYWWV